MSLSQTAEQHSGQQSEVYPDCPGYLLMHLLVIELESSTLHCIATCTLILHHGLSIRLRAQSTGTHQQMGLAFEWPASGRTDAFIGDCQFAVDIFAASGRHLTPARRYGDVQRSGGRSCRLRLRSGGEGIAFR